MRIHSFIFILQITFILLLPSDDMWNKVMEYYNEGKMKDFNKTHFIFDEYNYTNLDINDDKMKVIYEKQEYILNNYGIYSYIFAVKYINESIESLEHFRNNTRNNLKNFSIDVTSSVFTIVSIDSINGKVYTGAAIRLLYIPDSEAAEIKKNLLNNIRNKNYYNAFLNFVEDIDKYSYKNFTIITTTSSGSHSSFGGGSNKDWMKYTFPIIGVVVLGGLVTLCFCCCKNIGRTGSTSNDSYDDRYRHNYNNNYNDNQNTNCSINNYSVGGNSVGGNSVGGNSVGGNSVGGNSFHSGGA